MPSLYSTHRPKEFSQLIGQSHITKLLKAELTKGLVGHAYLFIGPRGTGKTTTARILAKALNCNSLKNGEPCGKCSNCIAFDTGRFLDLIEIDAASNRGIDEIREIKEKIEYNPTMGKNKIYIIDEVHMLTKEAFNALLKTLEEPPSYVTFILATTEPHKIPATIMSRCEKYEFRLGNAKELAQSLVSIMETENIKVDKKGVELLIAHASGSYRDAVSLLDTIIAATGDKELTFDEVRNSLGLPDTELVNSYVLAIAGNSLQLALETLDEIFTRGTNIVQFTKSVILLFRDSMLEKGKAGEIGAELTSLTRVRFSEIIKVLLDAYTAQKYAFDQRLPLQLATIQLIPDEKMEEPIPASEKKVTREVVVEVKSEKGLKSKTAPGVVISEMAKSKEMDEKQVVMPKRKLRKKKGKKRIMGKPIPFDTIVDLWTTFTRAVQKEVKHLYTFLVPAVPAGVQFDTQLQVQKVEVKVPFDFHRKQLENPKHQAVLVAAALKTYGTPVQFIWIISKEQIVFKKDIIHDSSKSPLDSANFTQQPVEAPMVETSLESAFDSILGADVETLG
ncbi:DNA polymerase III subunit gamma/tau [bacterium]|nr:DNA polymerase III subunit gamma/tau [bacterium]